jgi:hypothetical protein
MASAKLRRGFHSASPSAPLPSVMDLGRQIVRLLNRGDALSGEQLKLSKRSDISPLQVWKRENECDRLMRRAADRRDCLTDMALGMRARTLGDVGVMLGLAWRLADCEVNCEYDSERSVRSQRQIVHALLTSIDVIAREAGLDLEETVGGDIQAFIDREHADLGDRL